MKEWICRPEVLEDAGLEKDFFKRMGYASREDVPDTVWAPARKALKTALEVARPVAIVGAATVEKTTAETIFVHGICIESRLWAKLARKSRQPVHLALFALTLGDGLKRETEKASGRSLTTAYLLHEAGSEIIEKAADKIEALIRMEPMFQGLSGSRRFSPGYCDIPLVNQQGFFQFLHPDKIGIEMLASGGMLPEKSMTGAILYSTILPARSPCSSCKNKKCVHRRID